MARPQGSALIKRFDSRTVGSLLGDVKVEDDKDAKQIISELELTFEFADDWWEEWGESA